MNANLLSKRRVPRRGLAVAVGMVALAVLYAGHGRSYVSISYDPHERNCLPDLHLALLVHRQPSRVERGDYLFWKASAIPALSYVKEDFVLKQVAGLPGDTLRIADGKVYINGSVVAEGLENAALYHRQPADFARSGVIPPQRYFVIGTAPLSNDSRYWGYLRHDDIVGKGYRLY